MYNMCGAGAHSVRLHYIISCAVSAPPLCFFALRGCTAMGRIEGRQGAGKIQIQEVEEEEEEVRCDDQNDVSRCTNGFSLPAGDEKCFIYKATSNVSSLSSLPYVLSVTNGNRGERGALGCRLVNCHVSR